MKSFFIFFVSAAMIAAAVFSGSGCANMIPPSGGPRDSLPPVLLKAEPADSTLNFRGNRITLTFDEYVDLSDVSNNLLFTPIFETTPQVDVRLRTVTVRLKDSLEANTTYIFNFGNAIRDINESNPLRDFVYTFSTGPALDSLTLTGKVIMAETGAIDTTLIVILHKNLADSAVVKERPRYVTRVDRTGSYTFKNLPAGTFAIYALGEAGAFRRYQDSTRAFAFADSPIVMNGATTADTLFAFNKKPAATTNAATAPPAVKAGDNRLRFTPSIGQGGQQDLLKEYSLSFERPLRFFDSTKISLTTDSSFAPVVSAFIIDSFKKSLTVQTAWTEATRYNLVLDKDFAEDTLSRRLLKTDTLFFVTRKKSEYGSLNLRLRGINASLNPVLQFVQNGTVVFSATVSSGTVQQTLFPTGEYELRLLLDSNNNGIWDPGQFFGVKRQPELVRPIERRITIKPAWDNAFEITL